MLQRQSARARRRGRYARRSSARARAAMAGAMTEAAATQLAASSVMMVRGVGLQQPRSRARCSACRLPLAWCAAPPCPPDAPPRPRASPAAGPPKAGEAKQVLDGRSQRRKSIIAVACRCRSASRHRKGIVKHSSCGYRAQPRPLSVPNANALRDQLSHQRAQRQGAKNIHRRWLVNVARANFFGGGAHAGLQDPVE